MGTTRKVVKQDTPRIYGNLVADNALLFQQKDSGGTARSILGLDASNLTKVGPQTAPASGGDLLFYANGSERGRFQADGDFVVDTDTLFVDAANNRVGVGITSPTAKLHAHYVGITDKVSRFRSTYPSGTGGGQHIPFHFEVYHEATDLTPSTGITTGVTSDIYSGSGSVAGTGTTVAGTFSNFIQGSGSATNEHCGLFSVVRYDNTTTPGRGWLGDFSVHGAIAAQQNLLSGINMLINNHFNGSPTNGSVGMAIVTRSGSGGSLDGAHSAAETYPVDVGLAVVGHSAIAGTGIGFTTGIRVGGTGGGWMQSGTSRMGTGLHVRDYTTQGILINNRTAAATGPAMVVESGNGPILVGATSAMNASSLLELASTSTADPMATIGSVGSVATYVVLLRNAGALCEWFIVGSAGAKLSSTVAADAGIKISGTGKSFHLGGTNSKVVSVKADDTLSFFGATSVAKATSTADLRQALIDYGLYTTGGATPLNLNGGLLTAGTLKVTTSPASNYVLTSDATGNATWQPPASFVSVVKYGVD